MFRDQGALFSYVSPESRVPPEHPLRRIRALVRDVLKELSRSFARLYAHEGRPSVPPEQLLSALLIQALYGIRSERQLMEQLNYNLLYRWFVGLSPDDAVWDATTFTKNRERLQAGEVFEKFMTRLLNHPQVKPLLSDQHFSVDGTLIEAWASQRSFRPKDGSEGMARTSMGRAARTTRIRAPPIPTAYCIARRRAARRSCPIWGMSPWRTVTGWWWRACSARPREPPNGGRPRRCSRSDASLPDAASRRARTRPTTRRLMWRSFAPLA